MQMKRAFAVFVFIGFFFTSFTFAQTDVAASVYGAFNGATSANGVKQSPSNSAGVLFEVRHISNPLVGYEVTYAYNGANQVYTPTVQPASSSACPSPGCSYIAAAVPAHAHEITGDWVVSVKAANLRPFALAGGGFLLNVPTANSVQIATNGLMTGTKNSTQAVFVYGAGLDWTVLPHLGLRFQYRGNLYKAADLTNAFSSTNAFTHTSEPMVGAFLRF